MSKPLIVIVSGANRGIGKAMCDGVLSLSTARPIILYAASRAGADLAFTPAPHKGSAVKYPKLDITDSESIKKLVELVGEEGGVDALINNAGVNLDDKYTVENVQMTLKTNYQGTLEMNQAFLPLVRASKGRIVNLSSVGSQLKPYSADVQSRLRSVKSLQEIQSLADEYVSHVEKRTETESGWGGPRRAYSVSKALINAFTSVLAREEEKQGSGVLVNCCCPGWVSTDMGSLVGKPPKSPADGAKIPLRLAFGDIAGQSGKYWANDSISSTGDGKVQAW